MQSRIKPLPMWCNLSQRTRKPHHVSNSMTLIICRQTKVHYTCWQYQWCTTQQCFQHYFLPMSTATVKSSKASIHPSLPAYITPPHAPTPFQSVFVFACPPSPRLHLPFLVAVSALASDGVHFSFRPGAHHGCPRPQLLLWLR